LQTNFYLVYRRWLNQKTSSWKTEGKTCYNNCRGYFLPKKSIKLKDDFTKMALSIISWRSKLYFSAYIRKPVGNKRRQPLTDEQKKD